MAKTIVTIKTERKLKDQAQKVAKTMGFSLGTLVNAYLRQLVVNKVVYFSLKPSYFMSDYLENELSDVEVDLKQKKNFSKRFTDMKVALDDLKKTS